MGIVHQIKNRFLQQYKKESSVYKQTYDSLSKNGKLIAANELLPRAAEMFASEVALISKNKTINYSDFFAKSVLFANKLRSLGVKKSDRVILYFENSIEFYIGYFAIWHLGAVCAPLNVFLHERELSLVISDARPKCIVTSSLLATNLEKLTGKQEDLEIPTILTEKDMDFDSKTIDSASELIEDFPPAIFEPNELCLLLYTSGTTGSPKGVMLSSYNIVTNALQCLTRLAMHSKIKEQLYKERFFAALPLFHVFAQNTCIWIPIISGGSIVIVSRIDRKEILEGLNELPTIFFGVPALYGLLSLMKTAPLDKIKFFVSGGDAMPDKIRAAFAMVYGRKICSGYGLTEASPVVAVNMDNPDQQTNVVGRPLAGIKCEIRDSEGMVLNSSSIGELWIKGDNVMLGYYGSPNLTSEVIKDGWLDTGDLATIDSSGNLAIVGRSKDLIIHKGFNIYPQEVENVLLSHPAVFKAAVVGKEDAISGQVPVAFVALRDDDKNIERKLRDFCGDHLATYKIPRKIICLDDLPINQTGKIDKRKLLREHGEQF